MSKTATAAAPANTDAPDLKKLVTQASTDAQNAQRGSAGTVVAGPFPVGEIGQVQVIERQLGSSETKYLYAEFVGQGRPQRIPLAAVSVLAEKIA
jgi:hypothetical protein